MRERRTKTSGVGDDSVLLNRSATAVIANAEGSNAKRWIPWTIWRMREMNLRKEQSDQLQKVVVLEVLLLVAITVRLFAESETRGMQ